MFYIPSICLRLNKLILAGQTEIEDKILDIPGVERRGKGLVLWRDGVLSVPAAAMKGGGDANWKHKIRKCIDKITKSIANYEMKEGLTLFELALWKAKKNKS